MMGIGEIISNAFKYPSSGWVKVIILGVILFSSILIIPVFLFYGYLFRILKSTIAGLTSLLNLMN